MQQSNGVEGKHEKIVYKQATSYLLPSTSITQSLSFDFASNFSALNCYISITLRFSLVCISFLQFQ